MHLKRLLPRVLAALLTVTLLLAPASALDPEQAYIHGVSFETDPGPESESSVTYVQLRAFLESLGVDFTVDWSERWRTATVFAPGLTLTVREGDRYLTANGRCLYLYGTCYLLNDRLMVPVKPLAQACGMEAAWDEESCSVRLEGTYAPILSGELYYDAEDLYWLSRIIYAEAGIESFDGQVAVGNVVLNRMARKYWPDTVYDVVFDTRCGVQFTPTATGTIYQEPSRQAVAAAKIALEGVSLVEDSLFFVNESVASGKWFRKNCTYVTTLGRHTFYTNDIQ